MSDPAPAAQAGKGIAIVQRSIHRLLGPRAPALDKRRADFPKGPKAPQAIACGFCCVLKGEFAQMPRQEHCDIIVIGGGSAAHEAAVAAREAGAERIVMLE